MFQKLGRGVLRVKRSLYQRLLVDSSQPQQMLFIFGCQRSGTTMLNGLFRRDLASRVYTEKGVSRKGDLRMMPHEELRQMFAQERARLIVSKPIVESQHAAEILRSFPNSRAIWIFRNFADVARSSEKRFGPGAALRNLEAIVDPNAQQTFASANVSAETRRLVSRHFAPDMSSDDAHAMFWYTRNILFFEQELDRMDNVMLSSYERFVANPEENLREIYAFLGRKFPGAHLVSSVHARSVQTRPLENLSAEIKLLCDGLQSSLESCLH